MKELIFSNKRIDVGLSKTSRLEIVERADGYVYPIYGVEGAFVSGTTDEDMKTELRKSLVRRLSDLVDFATVTPI